MQLTIIGTGYVGLTSAVCFASRGHRVICVDSDQEKIQKLQRKIPTIYEDGMEDLLVKVINEDNIEFTTDVSYGIKNSEIVILAVGTPQDQKTGEADLQYIFAASLEAAKFVTEYKLFITKSTVPVGTNHQIKKIITQASNIEIDVASNPEFMREGFAIEDFLNPDRVVIGVESKRAKKLAVEIYQSWADSCPLVITDIKTAELTKYASNTFLMTKIAFINEIESLSIKLGCNIKDLSKAMGLDHRIGPDFLNSGPGVGGSCFPKDASALRYIAQQHNEKLSIINQVIQSNSQRFKEMAERIKVKFGDNDIKEISVLGLAFKAGTDDVRMSPAIEIIKYLLQDGFKIFVYDPKAIANSKDILNDQVYYCRSTKDCFDKSNHIAILTEWEDFKEIVNFANFNSKILIDLRKLLV